jgi:hypothetical protein
VGPELRCFPGASVKLSAPRENRKIVVPDSRRAMLDEVDADSGRESHERTGQ